MSIFYQGLVNLLGAAKIYRLCADNFISAKPGMKILDIGCGTGELINYLPEGVEYYGFDMNKNYIKTANRKYGHRGKFFQKKVDKSTINEFDFQFDLIISFALLHHLDDATIIELFNSIKQLMNSNGRFFTLDPTFVENQNLVAKLLIRNDRGQNVKTPEGYKSIASIVFTNVEVTHINNAINIPYDHCVLNCTS